MGRWSLSRIYKVLEGQGFEKEIVHRGIACYDHNQLQKKVILKGEEKAD